MGQGSAYGLAPVEDDSPIEEVAAPAKGKASIPQITYSNELIYGETIYVSSNGLPVKATCFEPTGHSFHDVALKLVGCFMEEKVEDDDEINDSLPKDKEPDYMQSAFSVWFMDEGVVKGKSVINIVVALSSIIAKSADIKVGRELIGLLLCNSSGIVLQINLECTEKTIRREGYVKFMADLIQKELQSFGSHEEVMIFFSTHGVLKTYVRDAGDLYRDQMEECIYLIMQEQSKRSQQ
nr:DnaJ homolog subfamily C member 2-like [Tanacetum cinerariifolium]